MTKISCKPLISGSCDGIFHYINPFSFCGGVDINTGDIIQKNHDKLGFNICDQIIGVSHFIGSSSGSSVLLELIRKKLQPKAIIMENVDAIVCLGSIVAQTLNLGTLPMFQCKNLKTINQKKILINENAELLITE